MQQKWQYNSQVQEALKFVCSRFINGLQFPDFTGQINHSNSGQEPEGYRALLIHLEFGWSKRDNLSSPTVLRNLAFSAKLRALLHLDLFFQITYLDVP